MPGVTNQTFNFSAVLSTLDDILWGFSLENYHDDSLKCRIRIYFSTEERFLVTPEPPYDTTHHRHLSQSLFEVFGQSRFMLALGISPFEGFLFVILNLSHELSSYTLILLHSGAKKLSLKCFWRIRFVLGFTYPRGYHQIRSGKSLLSEHHWEVVGFWFFWLKSKQFWKS